MDGMPKSRAALERAIVRYAGNDAVRANDLAVAFANAIVAQMVGAGVVKGGTSLKFRYGDKMTRVTSDLDTAWSESLDSFLKDVGSKLKEGWNGFQGEVQILEQANPRRVPFDYVMQPCSVRLSYLGKAWRVVDLEIGHNEIGDADAYDVVPVPKTIADLAASLAFPALGDIRVMKLEYQVAQKLHGVTEARSKRAHDLIDLQLIDSLHRLDLVRTGEICRQLFRYRRKQPWPPAVVKNENWAEIYSAKKGNLPVLPTVDEAIAWANALIARIANA
jgi:predicted nucleotidyltransferase component of viral defense system